MWRGGYIFFFKCGCTGGKMKEKTAMDERGDVTTSGLTRAERIRGRGDITAPKNYKRQNPSRWAPLPLPFLKNKSRSDKQFFEPSTHPPHAQPSHPSYMPGRKIRNRKTHKKDVNKNSVISFFCRVRKKMRMKVVPYNQPRSQKKCSPLSSF